MTTPCSTHAWTPTSDATMYACTECTETTHACHTCARPCPDANLACPSCLTRARRTLDDTREAATTPYTYGILGLKAIRYDTERTTGAATVEDPRGSTPARVPDGELFELTGRVGIDLIAILRDPPNVLEPLLDWADRWAETRNENAHGSNVFDYLASRLLWAANNPEVSLWHEYLAETHAVRARLRRLVGLAPTHHPTPCVHCGGAIIQEQTDRGLEDRLRCTGCGMDWRDREHLARVERTHAVLAPAEKPDTLVTLEEARAALPTVRRGTINVAIHRDRKLPDEQRRIPERGKNRRGQPLYRLGDLADTITAARAGRAGA